MLKILKIESILDSRFEGPKIKINIINKINQTKVQEFGEMGNENVSIEGKNIFLITKNRVERSQID